MIEPPEESVWNFHELRSLCSEMRAERINVFCRSFTEKFNYSDFYARRCREVFNSFHEQPLAVFHGEAWNQTWFEFEAYFLAFCGLLHSTVDTFAQIINLALFDVPIDEHAVSWGEIDKRETTLSTTKWRIELNSFFESPAFKYVVALNNTLKHRHLLDQSYQLNWNESEGATLGFMVAEFTYKKEQFPKMWAYKILEMREAFSIPLVSIGAQFNSYLREKNVS